MKGWIGFKSILDPIENFCNLLHLIQLIETRDLGVLQIPLNFLNTIKLLHNDTKQISTHKW